MDDSKLCTFGSESETKATIEGANTRNETLTNTSYEWRIAYFVCGTATSVYLYCSNMDEGQINAMVQRFNR